MYVCLYVQGTLFRERRGFLLEQPSKMCIAFHVYVSRYTEATDDDDDDDDRDTQPSTPYAMRDN